MHLRVEQQRREHDEHVPAAGVPKLAAGGATEYDVWYIAEDDNAQAGYGRSNNVQPASDISSQKLEVTTADVAPPTPASGFPKAKNVAATSTRSCR